MLSGAFTEQANTLEARRPNHVMMRCGGSWIAGLPHRWIVKSPPRIMLRNDCIIRNSGSQPRPWPYPS